jgi:hypothetical protein
MYASVVFRSTRRHETLHYDTAAWVYEVSPLYMTRRDPRMLCSLSFLWLIAEKREFGMLVPSALCGFRFAREWTPFY